MKTPPIRDQLAQLRATNDVLLMLGVWQAGHARQTRAMLRAIGNSVAISETDRAAVESEGDALDASLRYDLEKHILAVGDTSPALADHLREVAEAYGIGGIGNKI